MLKEEIKKIKLKRIKNQLEPTFQIHDMVMRL